MLVPRQTHTHTHTHIHTHTHTDRQTDRHVYFCAQSVTPTQTCSCLDSHTHTHTHTHSCWISECRQSTQTCSDLPRHLLAGQLNDLVAQPLGSGAVRGDDQRPFHWLCTNHIKSTISNFFPYGCVDIISYKQTVSMCEQLAIVLNR